MAEVLNLNNEVVKMRKEIKRVRVLIIRKLIRQSAKLKKNKGEEAAVEKNQRRAARLLEEIHAMKDLKPDNVTKIALMKNLSFENVCKNANSTMAERATARIATHPQISKRIQEIKAAVEAFKDERKRPARAKASKPGKPAGDPKVDEVKSDDSGEKEKEKKNDEKTKKDKEVEDEEEEREKDDDGGDLEDEGEQKEEGLGAAKDSSRPATDVHIFETNVDIQVAASKGELTSPPEKAEVQPEEKAQACIKLQETRDTEDKLENSKRPHTEDKRIQKPTENKPPPQTQSNSKMEVKSPRANQEKEEESDLDSSNDEGEKEYFDDSTEERFRKQSSQSEGSDEEDDFFLGKVSKFKKRKTGPVVGEVKEGGGDQNVKRTTATKGEAEGVCGGEDSRQEDSKAIKLQSVFCTNLSGSKGAPGSRGRGPSAISKPHRFQNDRRGQTWTHKPAPFQNRGGGRDGKSMSKFQNRRGGDLRGGPQVPDRGFAEAKARPQFENSRVHSTAPGRNSNPPQRSQALHPSWEASKRRKEQHAQITVFQGKKIKFDDD